MTDTAQNEAFNFNLEGVQASSFVLLDEGVYSVRCVEVKYIESPDKHTPGVEFTTVIRNGKWEKKKIQDVAYFTEKSIWKFKQIMSALVGREYNEQIRAANRNELAQWVVNATRPVLGNTALVTVQHKPYQKKDGGYGVSMTVTDWEADSEEDASSDGLQNPNPFGGIPTEGFPAESNMSL